MKFPGKFEFLDAFGIEPTEEDPSLAYCRYLKESSSDGCEIEISFSGVAESFQIVLRINERELINISSEKVNTIEIYSDKTGAGLRVIFDLAGAQAEALVTLEPDLHCHWWLLRTS